MTVFAIREGHELVLVRETSFQKEKEIQQLTEKNLETTFGLQFVKSEFPIHDDRVDTLAFDRDTQSFVVIEYKKVENYSVIDQGFSYLALLLNNQAEFVLEYNSCLKGHLTKENVGWGQSRVIFIAPLFTKYQTQAISFKDLPMELWEVHRYENGTILYNQLSSPEAQASIAAIKHKSEVLQKIGREIKTYTEDDLKSYGNEEIAGLYEQVKARMLTLGDDVKVKSTSLYIGFKRQTNHFADVEIQKSKLKVHVIAKWGQLKDPKGVALNVQNKGHWGNGDYELVLSNPQEIDDLMYLVKQAYDRQ